MTSHFPEYHCVSIENGEKWHGEAEAVEECLRRSAFGIGSGKESTVEVGRGAENDVLAPHSKERGKSHGEGNDPARRDHQFHVRWAEHFVVLFIVDNQDESDGGNIDIRL